MNREWTECTEERKRMSTNIEWIESDQRMERGWTDSHRFYRNIVIHNELNDEQGTAEEERKTFIYMERRVRKFEDV